jgi:short-subunit dehydrogenase
MGRSASPAFETDAATTEHIVRSNALWLHDFATAVCQTTNTNSIIIIIIIRAVTTTCTTLGHYQQHCGKWQVPLSAAYAASKFAIQGYSSLACERPDL